MHDDWVQQDHFWYRARFEMIKPLIPPPTGGKALDAACGVGETIKQLSQLGYEAIGVDIDDDAVMTARSNQLEVYQADSQQLPFKDNDFSLVTCLDGLEHMLDDEKALSEFYRVLKNGGVLLLNVPARKEIMGQYDIDVGHYRRYNKKELTEKLHRARFTIEIMKYWNFPGYLYSLFFPSRSIRSTSWLGPIAELYYFIERRFYVPIGLSIATKAKAVK